MNLSEMHVWFRQYAQQMGMQNVRALLPEQIDLLINTSITDLINQIIVQNIGVTNDRIITDNSKIGQINALKTLYTVKSIKVFDYSYSALTQGTVELGEDDSILDWLKVEWNISFTDTARQIETILHFTVGDGNIYTIDSTGKMVPELLSLINDEIARQASDYNINIAVTTGVSRDFSFKFIYFNGQADSVVQIGLIPNGAPQDAKGCELTPNSKRFTIDSDGVYKGLLKCDNIDLSYLYLVDFAIDYKKSTSGIINNLVAFDTDGFTTKYFPVRLIDDMYLADTLNDFILSPRLRSPILTVNANNYDLYFDKFTKVGNGYTLDNNLVPYTLRISYIAKPNKVEYRADQNLSNIDCNLPEYLHVDILKHAVDLYRASISGSMLGQQAQDQQQQREIARNNATPSDGYQNN